MSRKQRARRPAIGYNDSISLLKSIRGLTLALDYRFGVYTDTALTTPAAVGQTVKGWQDRSGNSYHATEATNPPTLASDGLTFDGINDVLRVTRMPGQFGAGFSYFVVASLVDGRPATTKFLLGGYSSPTFNEYFYIESATNGNLRFYVSENNVQKSSVSTNLADGQSAAFIAASSGNPSGNLQTYFNGSATGTPAGLSALTWANIASVNTESPFLGGVNAGGAASGFIACTIKSLIIYNRPLSTTELTTIHRYLGSKYAITVP